MSRKKTSQKIDSVIANGGGTVVFIIALTAMFMAMAPFYIEYGFRWIDLLWEVPLYGFSAWALWVAWKMLQECKEMYADIINREVANCISYLTNDGWSELIDPRWTLEVERRLKDRFPYYYEESIRKALGIVVYPKPDYNPENNEALEP